MIVFSPVGLSVWHYFYNEILSLNIYKAYPSLSLFMQTINKIPSILNAYDFPNSSQATPKL